MDNKINQFYKDQPTFLAAMTWLLEKTETAASDFADACGISASKLAKWLQGEITSLTKEEIRHMITHVVAQDWLGLLEDVVDHIAHGKVANE